MSWEDYFDQDTVDGYYKYIDKTVVSLPDNLPMPPTTDLSHAFVDCESLQDITAISSWDVSKVTKMNSMFHGCRSLQDITPISSWNTDELISVDYMFCGCYKLQDISPLFKWNLSKVTRSRCMFWHAMLLPAEIQELSFNIRDYLQSLPISKNDYSLKDNYMMSWEDYFEIDTKNGWYIYKDKDVKKLPNPLPQPPTTDFTKMFFYCDRLQDISGLSSWNTSNVTNMFGMFDCCRSLQDITPLYSWDISKVTDLGCMFCGCQSLQNINALSSWDTGSVKNMNGMFSGCQLLMDISGLSNWNTSNVTEICGMFSSCTALQDVTPISNWDISNVFISFCIFSDCRLLPVPMQDNSFDIRDYPPFIIRQQKNIIQRLQTENAELKTLIDKLLKNQH